MCISWGLSSTSNGVDASRTAACTRAKLQRNISVRELRCRKLRRSPARLLQTHVWVKCKSGACLPLLYAFLTMINVPPPRLARTIAACGLLALPLVMIYLNPSGVMSASESQSLSQCANSADTAAWNMAKGSFNDDMSACASKWWCLGGKECVARCMQDMHGYSSSCSDCFGDLTSCPAAHCKFQCMDGRSHSCDTCVEMNCGDVNAAFTSCSGINLAEGS